MSIRRMIAAVSCLLFSLAAAGAPPPVDAFGKVPNIASVEISPNGDMLAWLDSSSGVTQVVIYDARAGAIRRALDMGSEMKLRGVDWADDETVLIHVSIAHSMDGSERHRYEWFRTLAADVSGGPARMLLMKFGSRSIVTGAELVAQRTTKPKTVIMSSWDYSATAKSRTLDTRLGGGRKNSGWVLRLFEVDIRSGEGRQIDQGSQFTEEWVLDQEGQAVARSEWEPEQHLYRVLRKDSGNWNEIYRRDDGQVLRLYGLNKDRNAILALGPNGTALSRLWEMPLDGAPLRSLIEDAQYDVQGVARDGFSGMPVGALIGGPQPTVRWFDATAEARHKALLRTFGGRDIDAYARSSSGDRYVVRVGAHALPSVYYLVDFKKGTADVIGEDYPGLANVKLGEVRAMTYAARDGVQIPAYVTLPPGSAAKQLPLVVMPHGGPEWRDFPEFDWAAQFLASRGYAVLQPQFRGSTGFGEAHRKAGYRQWGGVMQSDLTDGVKALVEQQLADPRRVCIVGMSYGGYAALAGAAFTPDLYACAISVGGVSDLQAMLGYEAQNAGDESDTLAYWRVHIGSPLDPAVIAKSPNRAAAQVRAPILLLHGAEDTVVPIQQSQLMAKALQEAKKPHQLVTLPGEDHWLSRSETRVRVLTEMEAFLKANLPAAESE